MDVVVIFMDDLNSYNGCRTFRAVAEDTEAATKWVQDEVDGLHGNGHSYAVGKTAQYWIEEYPLFVFQTVTLITNQN